MSAPRANMATTAPFAKSVFAAMERLYPDALADKSFDNTGVLLEAPRLAARQERDRKALLTIDLTTAVANEAIAKRVSVVVTYHPIIFRALKHLRLGNPQQQSLLRLAAEGISIYSPHTAVDAAVGGNADWLADLVIGRYGGGDAPDAAHEERGVASGSGVDYAVYSWPGHASTKEQQALNAERAPITPNKEHAGAGMGRRVTLDEPTSAAALIQNLARGLAYPRAFQIALPQGTRLHDHDRIQSVGVCAGSGGSVVGGSDVHMIVTGEMSHHEALAAIEQGQIVVCLNHSNSERKYLSDVMQPRLEADLKDAGESSFEILVSEHDKDPFDFVVRAP